MASLWEPPALLTLALLLAGGAGAIYHALRPALKGPLPEVTSERDEVWGVDDPPPPPKKPYVYPAERPVPMRPAAPVTDREPEPVTLMPGGPTVAPLPTLAIEPHSEEIADDEDDELSLADLFTPRRRHAAAPNDAPTQD